MCVINFTTRVCIALYTQAQRGPKQHVIDGNCTIDNSHLQIGYSLQMFLIESQIILLIVEK